MSEIDLPEKLCSEHIASLVNLKYLLASTETSGVASLRGISLSSTMLDLVTVSPIQWGRNGQSKSSGVILTAVIFFRYQDKSKFNRTPIRNHCDLRFKDNNRH